jgi:glycosyltransferase involved in cell wall biosynthesis
MHVLSQNRLSGAENVAADICLMFEGVHEMAYCSPEGPIRYALHDRGVPYISLPVMSLSALKRAIKNYNPAIIHAHDVRATLISVFAAEGRPVISHLHGNSEEMRRLSIKSLLYFLTALKTEQIIVVSDSCLDDYYFKNKIAHKTICLPNTIYPERIYRLMNKDPNEYRFDFVYLGRISYPKDPQRIAKVASTVLKNCPNATFGVIGEGEQKLTDIMKAIFKAEGVSDRVTFTGRLSFPYKALKKAKFLLMCSRFEGSPIAALEAMALGVPIVSTPVDGLKHIIRHGVSGFLADEDGALSEFGCELLRNVSLQQRMSENTLKRFKEVCDFETYRYALGEIYTNIHNRKTRSSHAV